jgi:A/G-specific adenine glycosylase
VQKTPLEKVLQIWSGLGYNSRAKRLHDSAKIIIKKHKGKTPTTIEELLALPGIGPYTAKAILIFAKNKNIATIDTNIRRILIHEFKLDETIITKELERIAEQVLPEGKSRDWHNALMDYGTKIATAKTTGIKSKGKQSTFKGSRRELRAKLLKTILEKKKLTTQKAKQLFPETQYNIKEILEELKEEKLLKKEKQTYYIRN